MAKFSKKANVSTEISTASLPDIVFMLLFFFMVTTSIRETTLLVNNKIPQARQLQKLEKKSLVSFIFVGSPTKAILGTEPRIQLNDVIVETSAIPNFIEEERRRLDPSERDKLTISLKVDENSKMGIITDIKQELRKANALKLNYSAIKPGKDY
ncbi:MAG: biopolymer transporter ExbD [Bacteroidetes bacterium RIFCSPLOWO2_02_FULL_36_8]|nr:MAG: biopolymer transporter ExbD [Bacteroidetes bacterium RIFCSPLOWO2_02_FULL_36_8]OFY69678.1 MAG: biopolymer transporter ExbD [Bacteroidetes bacterium RIFCSPLOWO2_12_FULL_37_12]